MHGFDGDALEITELGKRDIQHRDWVIQTSLGWGSCSSLQPWSMHNLIGRQSQSARHNFYLFFSQDVPKAWEFALYGSRQLSRMPKQPGAACHVRVRYQGDIFFSPSYHQTAGLIELASQLL